MTEPSSSDRDVEPNWCWSAYKGAACLIAAGHKGGHAGNDLDGRWLRWTDEDDDASLD